jgi:xanthine dehydrogenase accessory factor
MRMRKAGWSVLVVELAEPKAVRRLVSYAQAVYSGEIQIEDTIGRLVYRPEDAVKTMQDGIVAVLVDPEASSRLWFQPDVIVDGRMLKRALATELGTESLVIGLGPGFSVGENCHAVVETNRGPYLGRVYWSSAQEDAKYLKG